jgi:phenylalanyl-tRNA synthetase beta chain
VRVPLSWLRDFAPFEGEPAELAATLDDLGLVVEEIELVNEGLGDVIVATVQSIASIEGADKIRKVVVDSGNGPVEVVCGAWNFAEGDLVPLAPVGAVLPGGFEIGRRKMKGVVSNGMLCSGRELKLSDDHEGILVLNAVEGASAGRMLTDALSLEPDVVFDIAVEANRPDAWCVAGVARDLAARLGLPFVIPATSSLPPVQAGGPSETALLARTGGSVGDVATAQVDDLDLCPRFTCRVITGVVPGPSPRWLAERLTLAGMRPINNVVDASNYVMLELGQPTHPYDLDRLPGNGLLVRRARPGETIVTLDGVERTLGLPGPGLGDTGQDCLICDAEGSPVGIGGVMGGASSEIDDSTSRVLLEAAYFDPMTIARTSKRLGLRTEASARFERGCDPAGIDRAAVRFSELLQLTVGEGMTLADGVIDIVGDVPGPVEMTVRPSQINDLLGTELTTEAMVDLLVPLGIEAVPAAGGGADGGGTLAVTVPTFRPDIRPAPIGESDIAEEVARTYGYSRIRRRTPSWPQPGRLTVYQSERRLLRTVLCGIGCDEVWTPAFVTELDQSTSGFEPPFVEITNPLVEAERFLRSSMAPGLIRAVVYNSERRQGEVRLFEVGSTFRAVDDGDADSVEGSGLRAVTSERLSAVFASEEDDAWSAVAAWRTIADAFRIAEWELGSISDLGALGAVLHPTRSASVLSVGATATGGKGQGRALVIGAVGELEPTAVGRLGLVGTDGRPRRVGWLDLDLGVLLDRDRVARRSDHAVPITRFPSSDIDLAFVVDESVSAGQVERTLRNAGGKLLESVALFDVFRAASVGEGARSLAFRLRFSSLERTLTDEEVGTLRSTCIDAVVSSHGARLR